MEIGGIVVDICEGGCGGIWLDQLEVIKFDEVHESAGEVLLDIERDENIEVDREKRLQCPRCGDVVLMRHFFSVHRQVEVDECPKCAGFWLDPGELSTIRSQYETHEERERAAGEYFDEIFGERLAAMHSESEEKREKARKFAHFFRFICPSYYIPGKQEWGAF